MAQQKPEPHDSLLAYRTLLKIAPTLIGDVIVGLDSAFKPIPS